MRRPGRRLLIPLLVVTLVACSWETDFVVINRTAGPVTVTYRLAQRPGRPCCPADEQLPPVMMPADSLRRRANYWKEAVVPGFKFDTATLAVVTELPAGYALRAGRESTYHGNVADLPLDSVRVTTAPGGAVLYRGRASDAFGQVSD